MTRKRLLNHCRRQNEPKKGEKNGLYIGTCSDVNMFLFDIIMLCTEFNDRSHSDEDMTKVETPV